MKPAGWLRALLVLTCLAQIGAVRVEYPRLLRLVFSGQSPANVQEGHEAVTVRFCGVAIGAVESDSWLGTSDEALEAVYPAATSRMLAFYSHFPVRMDATWALGEGLELTLIDPGSATEMGGSRIHEGRAVPFQETPDEICSKYLTSGERRRLLLLEQAAQRFARAFEARDPALARELIDESRPIRTEFIDYFRDDDTSPDGDREERIASDPEDPDVQADARRGVADGTWKGTAGLRRWFKTLDGTMLAPQLLACSSLRLSCRFAQLHALHNHVQLVRVDFDDAEAPVVRRVLVEDGM